MVDKTKTLGINRYYILFLKLIGMELVLFDFEVIHMKISWI